MRNFILLLIFCFPILLTAQKNKKTMENSSLPNEVKDLLTEYIKLLHQSKNLEDLAIQFLHLAGGNLVNENGNTLRPNIMGYSLKKDFESANLYQFPPQITRIVISEVAGEGYGASALAGKKYKIWIDKKAGAKGMPAPVQIIVPQNHSFIKKAKIVGIGSL